MGCMQHSEAASLLESAKNCRLCKFLISCVDVYSSIENYDIPTVEEALTLNFERWGPLIYSVGGGLSPYHCRFGISPEIDAYEDKNICFDVIFWAEDGTSYLQI